MVYDKHKDDVSNRTSFVKRSFMTFCMCVALYDRNEHYIEESSPSSPVRQVRRAPDHFLAEYVIRGITFLPFLSCLPGI